MSRLQGSNEDKKEKKDRSIAVGKLLSKPQAKGSSKSVKGKKQGFGKDGILKSNEELRISSSQSANVAPSPADLKAIRQRKKRKMGRKNNNTGNRNKPVLH